MPVRDAWARAHEIAIACGTQFQKARALNALDTYYRDIGDWHECEGLSEAALALQTGLDDPYLLVCLQSSRAALLLHTGQLKQSLALYDKIIEKRDEPVLPSFNWYNSTYTIGAYFRSAQCLWLMGDSAQAQHRAQIAIDRSETASAPFHRAITLFHVAMLFEFIGDGEAVRLYADELDVLSRRNHFGFYEGSAKLFKALSLVRDGRDLGQASVVQSITEQQRVQGTRMFEPYWRSNLAQAMLLSGNPVPALNEVEQALRISGQTRNQYWDAQLHTLAGDCAAAIGRPGDEVVANYQRAVLVAQEQGAQALRRRALNAMASWDLLRDT